jgi:hypothetical protein
MVRLLVMTAQINDNDLRRSIVNELTGGFDYGKI